METIALGTQGLTVSRQGLGCMGMCDFYGPSDDAESIATIHRALELGVTFFDTADMYGPFTNEVARRQALAGRRDEAVIATKFGIVRDPDDPTSAPSTGRPSTCGRPATPRSRAWASTTSTSTTSTASTPTRRSRRRWAPWPSW